MSESQPVFLPLVSLPNSATGFSEFYIHLPQSTSGQPEDAAGNDGNDAPNVQCADYFRIKAAVDRTLTVILVILSIPLMLTIAAAILLLDGRPLFYRQVRVGMGGREFRIWKFRTMRRNAETATGAVWSNKSDSRVTPLGRWLRCSHLDELPQFFNILAGEMNLIGPRPERPEFARELSRELPDYIDRTVVRPGITGLAQLRLGYDHSVADVRKKLKLDLRYIRSATFSQDVWLLTCTLPYIARQLMHRWKSASPASSLAGSQQAGLRVLELVAPPVRRDRASDLAKPKTVPRYRRSMLNTHAAGDVPTPVFKVLSAMDPARDERA